MAIPFTVKSRFRSSSISGYYYCFDTQLRLYRPCTLCAENATPTLLPSNKEQIRPVNSESNSITGMATTAADKPKQAKICVMWSLQNADWRLNQNGHGKRPRCSLHINKTSTPEGMEGPSGSIAPVMAPIHLVDFHAMGRLSEGSLLYKSWVLDILLTWNTRINSILHWNVWSK